MRTIAVLPFLSLAVLTGCNSLTQPDSIQVQKDPDAQQQGGVMHPANVPGAQAPPAHPAPQPTPRPAAPPAQPGGQCGG